ncbi:fumarylacetoacetate hydrolase family protein [Roseinatronobacter sp. S2]|uniref:fumarylacetoacetate hydrolase family protein n=1 Tax=Roseinatronobacter sp. S2 TaxID=3035471 RepID=UPI002410A93F|nr:fumarylacetoacetate hydrolase family protein [Roseinatronobacter sp. S2]WFE73437.1 fumarylacetoacetate hydrolase family protein [Roseinatronobacter sp. S2]
MKLLRFGPKGQEKPGCLDTQGNLRDLSGVTADFGGDTVSLDALAQLAQIDPATLPVVDQPVRIGAPLAHVPNFYCIGLNYAAHAAETGAEKPKEPLVFSKATSSLAGPQDPIIIPRGATRTDWEVELGIIIGKPALYVDEADALEYVAGYCAVNDVSERDFQKNRGGQWIKGKSAPGFGKIGPWLVTADDVPDPQALRLQLSVNGDPRQDSTTADMIFTVAQIVSYMSRFMELLPGDVIATGTPSGVAAGMSPPQFLKPGDVVSLTVEGLGTQKADVIAAS